MCRGWPLYGTRRPSPSLSVSLWSPTQGRAAHYRTVPLRGVPTFGGCEDEGTKSASHGLRAHSPPLRLWTARSRCINSNRFDTKRPTQSKDLLDGLRRAAPRCSPRPRAAAEQLRAVHSCRGRPLKLYARRAESQRKYELFIHVRARPPRPPPSPTRRRSPPLLCVHGACLPRDLTGRCYARMCVERRDFWLADEGGRCLGTRQLPGDRLAARHWRARARSLARTLREPWAPPVG